MEVLIFFLIFVMGAFVGSFCSLAIHRLPLGLDITHTRSYCPKCMHKLKFFELIPIVSYIALGGKCRWCGKKIKPKYLIMEVLSGIIFVLFALSLKINFLCIENEKLYLLAFSFLYFIGVFIIAGIDKEKIKIQKSVLLYTIIVSVAYILYLFIVQKINIYRYIIYLILIILIIILDILGIRKKGDDRYLYNIVILALSMSMFTGEEIFLITFATMVLSIFIYKEIYRLKNKPKKYIIKENEKRDIPIAFFMIYSNIAVYILASFIVNYLR